MEFAGYIGKDLLYLLKNRNCWHKRVKKQVNEAILLGVSRGNLRHMKLVLFFTYNVSLQTWAKSGLFDREILLYDRLTKHGVAVTFITYGDESDFMIGDKMPRIRVLPIYSLWKKPQNKLLRFIQSFVIPFYLKKILKGTDILKTNQMYGAWVPIIAKLLFNKKVILRCGYEWYRNICLRGRGKEKKTLLYKMAGFLMCFVSYKVADRIIISNQSDADFIKKKFFVESEKIFILGNYIDVNQFNWCEPGQSGRILFIGRLTSQKNLFNLCHAIKDAGIGLDIIGDGELREKVHNMVHNNMIDVKFLGIFPNSKLPEMINKYKVFTLPSFFENNPKTLLEAMACGRAVIGTDVDGIREVISHGNNGLLCETSSVSIGEAIKSLENDEQLCLRLGKEARKYVKRYHSLNSVVKAEYKIFHDVINAA